MGLKKDVMCSYDCMTYKGQSINFVFSDPAAKQADQKEVPQAAQPTMNTYCPI